MAMKTIGFLACLITYLQCNQCSPEESILGHMLPLGSHRKSESVEERFDIPSAKDFFEKYVLPSKAVVLRGILKDSPMFHTWTDEYLLEKYPDFELRLEAKTEKEGYVPMGDVSLGRDSFKNFIETYHQTNKYVVSELPTPAWDEFLVPPSLTCGPVKHNMVEIDLWMSGGSTSSLLHKDAFNTLNCLVNGTKEWKLFEYKYEGSLYKAYEAGDPKGGFSRINPEAVDLKKYPKVCQRFLDMMDVILKYVWKNLYVRNAVEFLTVCSIFLLYSFTNSMMCCEMFLSFLTALPTSVIYV